MRLGAFRPPGGRAAHLLFAQRKDGKAHRARHPHAERGGGDRPFLARVPSGVVDMVIVADGGSTDRTIERAREMGANRDRGRTRLWASLLARRARGRR